MSAVPRWKHKALAQAKKERDANREAAVLWNLQHPHAKPVQHIDYDADRRIARMEAEIRDVRRHV